MTVTGTSEADVIDVYEVGGQVTVVVNQNAESPLYYGAASAVRIDSAGGDDIISYAGDTLSASLYLKNGTDFLQISMTGSSSAMVFSGNGDDLILADGNVTICD